MSIINLKIKQLEDLPDEALIEYYRGGHREAVEILVQRYKSFVRKRIKSKYFIGADKEDLIQEGMIGLFKAICDYSPLKDTSFKSFATLCVTRQISTAFKTATRQKHIPLNTSISLNLPMNNEEDENVTLLDMIQGGHTLSPEDFVIDQESLENLQKSINNSLSPLERQVLSMHSEGKNYQEIAQELDKSAKSIDNALQRIKRKLGHCV